MLRGVVFAFLHLSDVHLYCCYITVVSRRLQAADCPYSALWCPSSYEATRCPVEGQKS